MRGVNIQKITIEREENEKLYKALDILKEFSDKISATMYEVNLDGVEELVDLVDDIQRIVYDLNDFVDGLGCGDYIEIEG